LNLAFIYTLLKVEIAGIGEERVILGENLRGREYECNYSLIVTSKHVTHVLTNLKNTTSASLRAVRT